MRKKGIVIAIDGPAGAGKSTTARGVAGQVGYLYLDTGAMYRALGLGLLRAGVDPDDGEAAARLGRRLRIDLHSEAGEQRTLLNGEDVSLEIRTPAVSDAASRVAAHPAVREVLVARQREMGRDGGIVLEGRDTGTAVFPDAELKLFLVADVEARARRRQQEMDRRGERVDLEALVEQIRERDARDASTQSRLGAWPAPDAHLLDTTGLSVKEQVDRVVDLAVAWGVRLPPCGDTGEQG